jgi:hypothetical protein
MKSACTIPKSRFTQDLKLNQYVDYAPLLKQMLPASV